MKQEAHYSQHILLGTGKKKKKKWMAQGFARYNKGPRDTTLCYMIKLLLAQYQLI